MTTAIILAGGLGTRLRSVVSDVPKPMAPIAGKPFLHWQLDYWCQQGIDRFVLAVGYKHEVISDYFGTRFQGRPIVYSVENSPIGTGGALFQAMNYLLDDGPFVLLNGDTYFAVSLDALMQSHQRHQADVTFALFASKEVGRYMGMAVDDHGRIRALKSGSAEVGALACGGVYVMSPQSLQLLQSQTFNDLAAAVSLEDEVFPKALESGYCLQGGYVDGAFIDIGIPNDYHNAHTVIAAAPSQVNKEMDDVFS